MATPDSAFIALHNLDHDPELAKALGDMAVAWSSAEFALQIILSKATGVKWPMIDDIYYLCPTFESRTKMIRAAVNSWSTTTYDKASLTDAINRLAKLATTRNRLVHARWVVSMDRKRSYIMDMRKPLWERRKQITANAVNEHVKAVRGVSEEIHRLTPD